MCQISRTCVIPSLELSRIQLNTYIYSFGIMELYSRTTTSYTINILWLLLRLLHFLKGKPNEIMVVISSWKSKTIDLYSVCMGTNLQAIVITHGGNKLWRWHCLPYYEMGHLVRYTVKATNNHSLQQEGCYSLKTARLMQILPPCKLTLIAHDCVIILQQNKHILTHHL